MSHLPYLISFLRLFFENAEIDQETISRVDGQFEIVMTDVEVEEAVFRPVEIDQLAAVAAPSHAAAEGGNFRKRRDPIRCAMEKYHGWQFSANVSGRAKFGAEFRRRKTLGELAFGRGVDQRAEEDQCFRAERWSQILVFSHP